MASVTVSTTGRPSEIAETARATAVRKISEAESVSRSPSRTTSAWGELRRASARIAPRARRLLSETDDRVQEDHREDHPGVGVVADRRGHGRGDQKHVDEGVAELVKEERPERLLAL
jgi:hypothetical protein